MKSKFLVLVISLFTFSGIMAQKKNTAVKAGKNSTKTTSENPVYQQSESKVINSESKSSKELDEIIDNKYKIVIEKNLAAIKEIDQKIAEKMNAYSKDEKYKNNSAITAELVNARFQMIAELIGPDAANYYIKKH
jgi:CHASE3 domain sensor protein